MALLLSCTCDIGAMLIHPNSSMRKRKMVGRKRGVSVVGMKPIEWPDTKHCTLDNIFGKKSNEASFARMLVAFLTNFSDVASLDAKWSTKHHITWLSLGSVHLDVVTPNASHFDGLEVMNSSTSIFEVSHAFGIDTSEHGRRGGSNLEHQPSNVLNVVKKAENLMLRKREDKEYPPVDGLPTFNKVTAEILLGSDNPLLNKVASVQCCGGTGSLRVGATFIKQFFPRAIFLISSPTRGNHKEILNEARISWSEYRYLNPTTMKLDFHGMIADIKAAPKGSIILLQGCAHNPTCIDPTVSQWEKIADAIQEKTHIPFFDVAYQGLASGSLDVDAKVVRMFGARGMEVIVAQSYSKNLGLYAERIGALNFICSSPDTCARVKSQLKWLIAGMYAFPPIHGARIVTTIATEPHLLSEWKAEIATIATTVKIVRRKLYDSLSAREKGDKDWSFILDQFGIFSYIGLSKEQIEYMEREWHVYVIKDGRLPLAGMCLANCDYVADAIIDSSNVTY